jgi:RNA polymerase sigma factor (sigma-70 family)
MGSRCSGTETTSEEALVRASRRGNQQAIETLFRRYPRQLLGAARRILGNTEDAEDALQDGLLSAYRNVRRFEGRSKFSTWLTRIVVNAALSMTAMISGPRYGSTVGTSLVISANSSTLATRSNFAYEDNARRPSDYSADGWEKLHTSNASPSKNPENLFSSWEYFSKLRVIPNEHDNATLGAMRKQCQAPPAILAVCVERQIASRRSGLLIDLK